MMRIIFFIPHSYIVVSIFAIFKEPSFVTGVNADQIDCGSTKIWGPGLDPVNLILPVRYFFVETHDRNGNRYVFVI